MLRVPAHPPHLAPEVGETKACARKKNRELNAMERRGGILDVTQAVTSLFPLRRMNELRPPPPHAAPVRKETDSRCRYGRPVQPHYRHPPCFLLLPPPPRAATANVARPRLSRAPFGARAAALRGLQWGGGGAAPAWRCGEMPGP